MSEVVDHIKPVADDGAFWDESNWQALAKRCHDAKTAGDVATRTFGNSAQAHGSPTSA